MTSLWLPRLPVLNLNTWQLTEALQCFNGRAGRGAAVAGHPPEALDRASQEPNLDAIAVARRTPSREGTEIVPSYIIGHQNDDVGSFALYLRGRRDNCCYRGDSGSEQTDPEASHFTHA